MPKILFKNNAYSTLAAGITNVATTLSVQTGHGDRFPIVAGTDVAYITLEDSSGNREIVKVTARTSGADSMTIVRAQEGTSARAWNSGDVVEQRITAGELDRFEQMSNVEDSSSKATPVDADMIPLKDSAASNALKYLTWANLKATLFAAWGALVSAGTSKATPVDGDSVALSDSAASNATKKLTWANIKATLKSYFDTLYGSLATQNQWTKLQRCGVVTDNDGGFDMTGAAGNMITWTPTGADVLDFTNEIAGANGVIYLDNSSGYAITLGGEVIGPSTLAADLSTAGKYEITFRCYNGTNVVCQHSEAVA